MEFLQNPIFIWTDRSTEQIINSQMKHIENMTAKMADAGIEAYRECIEKYLNDKNLHKINMTDYIPEPELIKRLEDILKCQPTI